MTCIFIETFIDLHTTLRQQYSYPQTQLTRNRSTSIYIFYLFKLFQEKLFLFLGSLYYNVESTESPVMDIPTNDYVSFHTLV